MSSLLKVTLALPKNQTRLTSTQQQIVHDFRRKMHASSIWIEVKESEDE